MHKDTKRKFPRLVIYYINFTKMFLQTVETLISFYIPVVDCKKNRLNFFSAHPTRPDGLQIGIKIIRTLKLVKIRLTYQSLCHSY